MIAVIIIKVQSIIKTTKAAFVTVLFFYIERGMLDVLITLNSIYLSGDSKQISYSRYYSRL